MCYPPIYLQRGVLSSQRGILSSRIPRLQIGRPKYGLITNFSQTASTRRLDGSVQTSLVTSTQFLHMKNDENHTSGRSDCGRMGLEKHALGREFGDNGPPEKGPTAFALASWSPRREHETMNLMAIMQIAPPMPCVILTYFYHALCRSSHTCGLEVTTLKVNRLRYWARAGRQTAGASVANPRNLLKKRRLHKKTQFG